MPDPPNCYLSCNVSIGDNLKKYRKASVEEDDVEKKLIEVDSDKEKVIKITKQQAQEVLDNYIELYDRIEYYKKLDYDANNDDLIYLPRIMVFKTDESVAKLMEDKDCYYVDVITSAAPDLAVKFYDWNEYRILMYNRLKKIIQVAKKENVDIFILGAYGCGAFHNPPEIIASLFKELLNEYHFDTVEFAVYCYNDDKFSNYNVFKNILEN